MKFAPVLAAVVVGTAMVAGPAVFVRSASLEAQVPVRLFLDQSRYAPGAEGHVRVQIGKDGYLLVLYAQPDGHVDVAYPLDPGVSDRVEADTEIEVVRRGDTTAFTVEDSSGSGTWYAAIASKPFRLRSIAVNGHWDYRVVPRVESTADAESELTSFVEGVSEGRFDYDIVSFVIDTAAATRASSTTQAVPVANGPPAVVGPPPAPPPPWWVSRRAAGGPLVPLPWAWAWWGWGGTGPWAGPYLDRTTPGGTIAYAPHPTAPSDPQRPPPVEPRVAPGNQEHPAPPSHEAAPAGTTTPSAPAQPHGSSGKEDHPVKAPAPEAHAPASGSHPSSGGSSGSMH